MEGCKRLGQFKWEKLVQCSHGGRGEKWWDLVQKKEKSNLTNDQGHGEMQAARKE